ncbi:hypothetical protein HZA57_05475 [Candidatus Poribacteria bacterium]|nr:hypothetical protein [Candidatus Poribacteria bacterium]
MASLARWVKGHFLYAMGTAIVLVIVGAFMAFKLDNKSGYIVFVAG